MKYIAVNVEFTSGLKLSAEFRQYWKCLTFYSCDYWKPATEVFWSPIPKNAFVALFETDSCWHGGKWYYISREAPKIVQFEKTKPIRSMMIGTGRDYFRRPHIIYNDCKLIPDEFATVGFTDVEEIDTASNSSNEWTDDQFTVINGDLSSNWTAALPD